MLTVSIVISNFNYGSFLRSAVDSALSQTYQPCEVIVVDDGSTDDSIQILGSYGERIKIFEVAHQGETASRNVGFAKASGDLVCFLDSDDFLQTDTASRVVEFWKPSFSKVQYQMRVVDHCGIDQGLLMPRCRLDSGVVSSRLLRTGRYITAPGSGNFYARSFLEKIVPVPVTEWPQSFDSYAATYAGFLGEVGAIQEPLASYRVHNNNMTRMVKSSVLEQAQVEKLLERQLRLRRLLLLIAAQMGLKADPNIVISHWAYLKLELVRRAHKPGTSLREISAIVGKMIISAVKAPELTLTRRIQLIAWALGSAILPRQMSQQIMNIGFDLAPEGRLTRVLRRL
jgi:glycosyltransferase involved in cell wall biosynthesis